MCGTGYSANFSILMINELTNVMLLLRLIKHHAMKTCRGLEVCKLHN
jgi:hypothetical protein